MRSYSGRIGLPPQTLVETVRNYNALVNGEESTDVNGMPAETAPPVFTIDTPPFYAMRTYPMANKSAGGISIDLGARALDADGQPVPQLYAAGEVTGSAGMNGLNGLDGMFTGPAIVTGRVAGRTVVADLAAAGDWTASPVVRDEDMFLDVSPSGENDRPRAADLDASDLAGMLETTRDGYWHFERVHELVLERDYPCSRCHSDLVPFAPAASREQNLAQARTCDSCHLAPAGTLDPTAHQEVSDKID